MGDGDLISESDRVIFYRQLNRRMQYLEQIPLTGISAARKDDIYELMCQLIRDLKRAKDIERDRRNGGSYEEGRIPYTWNPVRRPNR